MKIPKLDEKMKKIGLQWHRKKLELIILLITIRVVRFIISGII